MYVIRNNGRFPVVVRDLNYHIEGGKSIDLDLVFRRENVESSVDLKNLIKCKKVEVLNKDSYNPHRPTVIREGAPITPSTSNSSLPQDSAAMLELLKEIKEMKNLIGQGVAIGSGGERVVNDLEGYDEETRKKIADLQARSLSQNKNEVEKNFENIGNVTEKKDSNINDMLDILDSLDN